MVHSDYSNAGSEESFIAIPPGGIAVLPSPFLRKLVASRVSAAQRLLEITLREQASDRVRSKSRSLARPSTSGRARLHR
jgi:hypothetical protein